MSLERKALAKYGAKIPTARSTGAKRGPQGEAATSAEPVAKGKPAMGGVGDKKRGPR
jgi:hypothetical protein